MLCGCTSLEIFAPPNGSTSAWLKSLPDIDLVVDSPCAEDYGTPESVHYVMLKNFRFRMPFIKGSEKLFRN
jgi:hypothetical protein